MSETFAQLLLGLSYCAPGDGDALACYAGKGALLALFVLVVLAAAAFWIARAFGRRTRGTPRSGDVVAGFIGGLLGLWAGIGFIRQMPRDLYLPPLCLVLGSVFATLGAEALRRRACGRDA